MKHVRAAFSLWYSSGPARQDTQLTAERDFRLNHEGLGPFFSGDVPPRLVDLLRIAMAVYIVDRRVRRGTAPARSWARELKLRVEVLDPGFWQSADVVASLRETVEYVSGDYWDFEFAKDSRRYEATAPLLTRGFAAERPLVCLYSGGLDSAAGLGLRVTDQPDRPVIPVTVKHQPRQTRLTEEQFELLRARHGIRIEPLVVKASRIRLAGAQWDREETSQRSRSFLFASSGAIAAILSGVPDIEVFESGVGAINVPLMVGMTGTRATRGSHPEFLRRMSRLASLIAERAIAFQLPFFGMTKGEMVRSLKRNGIGDLAACTVSCAHYPRGHDPYTQCGICPACVFRRQAMLVGDVAEPSGTYSFDLFGPPDEVNTLQPDKLVPFKAFLMQVAKWSNIDQTGRLPESVERYLRDSQILQSGESNEPIKKLLVRNRDEWMAIAEAGRRMGYQWARLLAPAHQPAALGASHATA